MIRDKKDGLFHQLSKGDIILADYDNERAKIRTTIPIYNSNNGNFIKELKRNIELKIVDFKINPRSGLESEWIEVKTKDGTIGLINPYALIYNFKYIKKTNGKFYEEENVN